VPYGTLNVIVSLLEEQTVGEEVVAPFLHARFSTLFRSSSSARAVPKRKGRTLKRKGMDRIWDTRCVIHNMNPRGPRRQNELWHWSALPQEVVVPKRN
jgi:hypothetical protein